MVDWSYFDKFEHVIDKYMELYGEGNTKASQTVTAVNELIYKWYNDGDVFDNTYHLDGWCNDLSSYANWLSHFAVGAEYVLSKINICYSNSDYENLLKELADLLLDEELLEKLNKEDRRGSIYECDDKYEYYEHNEEDEYEE